ncbi:SCO family protein [Devosia neptuniae]|jgi:protein SCO1|uniref:SCO family protein n=1 Tax=Devosia TaxID=46913 RepID=UPI0022B03017|nr:SCO family protein [Devosia neptuniae]MCZ4346897.1 SCO family protein [Devosia neptuniae]|tara:strand:+ start:1176 stop:1769 length:594 start_codon:yes stop_codon:yes gene_type:complete
MDLGTIRFWLWGLVGALALTAGAGVFLLREPPKPASGFGTGSYDLVDQKGNAVDETIFVGHPSALFFGFTHCPEVCPTTMAEMAGWFEALGDEGEDLRAYFVTVDPERDTPEILADYVGWVSDRITGLTGSPEEIAKIARSWAVFYERVPLEGDDYTMDHSASVFLIDDNGEFQGTIAYREDQTTALAKLRMLLAKS